MVGIIISDSFLLCGVWELQLDGSKQLNSLSKIVYNEPITNVLHNESELNTILAPILRKSSEEHELIGQSVNVVLPDSFIKHGVVELESGMSRDDSWQFLDWLNKQKKIPNYRKYSTFGQVYMPGERNIHSCSVPSALIRTLKLSIIELGGMPKWMGPASSLYLDGTKMTESAVIYRTGNRYDFYKIQNNYFAMGKVSFSGGVPKLIYSTDDEETTLAALGLIKSDLDDIPVFSPQKLGRQAKQSWSSSDLRYLDPFLDVELNQGSIFLAGVPDYDQNVFSMLINSINTNHSLNFFEEQGLKDFFFTTVLDSYQKTKEKFLAPDEDVKETNDKEKIDTIVKQKTELIPENLWALIAAVVIVIGFISFQYLKLREELNLPILGSRDDFIIQRDAVDRANAIEKNVLKSSSNLIIESQAISEVLVELLSGTDLDRYNSLTITKNFASMEYITGANPNIENLLDIEPSSLNVEPVGTDSTIFSWYYNFEMPNDRKINRSDNMINKESLLTQLDTTLSDYTIKYYEQLYLENQIYEPILIWVRNKSDILQASAIISNTSDEILMRKFVLFNDANAPDPRAGFYISLIRK